MREMMKIARRIVLDVSTAVKQWRGIGQWSRSSNKNRDLSTAVKQWSGVLQWPSRKFRYFDNPFIRHLPHEVGYSVDVSDLLFTPERDFLVKNNGQKIKVGDLRGKSIVLYIVPLDVLYWRRRGMQLTRPGAGETWDMIEAYCELLRVGSDVEFVFVPVRIRHDASVDERFFSEEAFYHQLFSTVPFPAIPLSDAQGQEGPVVQTFAIDDLPYRFLPFWVLIDPTNTVMATRGFHPGLFKLFGGAELHPLTGERIWDLQASHQNESLAQRISKWDQLLASDTRDFLLSRNGEKVPISSLKGKLIGLYFCENIPHPPRMQAIKMAYEEAKSRGYDFEIVQITFHYHPFNARHLGTDPSVLQCCEDVSWLTLPFKDPSCRKLQRILRCEEEAEDEEEGDEHWVGHCLLFKHRVGDCLVDKHWVGDSLVLIHPHQGEAETEVDQSSGVQFELSGAEILEIWGIEGYPFTRQSIYKLEYEVQKREVTLQSLFPPGERLLRSVGDGFDLVDAVSQLSGKRVLVLFAKHYRSYGERGNNFVSMLKSKYVAQQEENVGEESKFEVVYVSTGDDISSFDEFTKDMPWLVRPFSSKLGWDLVCKVFKANVINPCAAAFNEQGELIAKAENLLHEKKQGDKLQFPFIDQDMEKCIGVEVDAMCDVANYRSSGNSTQGYSAGFPHALD